jgi:tetratricopeptide (TPR) repeat protein
MRIAVAGLVAAGLCIVGSARTDEPSPLPPQDSTDTQAVRPLLDAVQDDLLGLRFEQALTSLEALLGRPGLSEADRGEALVLRSQAHVAFGDLDAAEQDYREILRIRPGYVPDSSLVPQKAMERFHRARATTIGDLVLDAQPSDARVLVDGREIGLPAGSKIPLVAGEHVVRVERAGFDPLQQTVRIEANQDARVELRLVPNARTVVIETEPAGVDVTLDGAWIGRTARSPDEESGGTARKPARLTVESLSLGEHVFELAKECYRGEIIRDLLTVDLLDWSPKVYPLVVLAPARSTVVLRGGPDGAEVRVDDRPLTRLPTEPFEVCPGERRLEARLDARRIWSRVVSLGGAEEAVIEVDPRPNVVLLGVERWPLEMRPLAEAFNVTIETAGLQGTDLSDPDAWKRLDLPGDADLAVAPRAADEDGGPAWWLYSPLLQAVTPVAASPPTLDRPQWSGASWGLAVVDSVRHGPALVAHVAEDGPAAKSGLRAGDRLISLGGAQLDGAARAVSILTAASVRAPLEAEWLSPDGTARRGRLEGEPTLRLVVDTPSTEAAMVRAAWAELDAACDEALAPVARANLALLLSAYGRHELAAQVWKRVGLSDRAGIGSGTVQYYLGRELQRLGAEREAIRAQRAAAASEATAFDDEGPRVAPAARDRLADFGVQ